MNIFDINPNQKILTASELDDLILLYFKNNVDTHLTINAKGGNDNIMITDLGDGDSQLVINGGTGNDQIFIGGIENGSDIKINSGLGFDVLTIDNYSFDDSFFTNDNIPEVIKAIGSTDVALAVTDKNLIISGGRGTNYITSGSDNDVLRGGNGFDQLTGGFGNDNLYGGDSSDRLYGDSGGDILIGSIGTDTLYISHDSDQDQL